MSGLALLLGLAAAAGAVVQVVAVLVIEHRLSAVQRDLAAVRRAAERKP